jgi:hypothetical protein
VRQLFEISAAFVMRQIGRVRFKAHFFERFAKGVERPAAAEGAVHEHNRRCHRPAFCGGALHKSLSIQDAAAPFAWPIIMEPPYV